MGTGRLSLLEVPWGKNSGDVGGVLVGDGFASGYYYRKFVGLLIEWLILFNFKFKVFFLGSAFGVLLAWCCIFLADLIFYF